MRNKHGRKNTATPHQKKHKIMSLWVYLIGVPLWEVEKLIFTTRNRHILMRDQAAEILEAEKTNQVNERNKTKTVVDSVYKHEFLS